MTMVRLPRQLRIFEQIQREVAAKMVGVVKMAMMVLLCLGMAAPAIALPPSVPYEGIDATPPGAIGQQQLLRGGPLRGYFQPVQIQGPPGSMISVAVDGKFTKPQKSPITVGLLIGQVYRVRVMGIPVRQGQEVYPSIEVIDRLYPPPGKKAKFPIPVQLIAEELKTALDGRFVTRVVYLEETETALPRAQKDSRQSYFEIDASADPLTVADELGRPVAIVRMGSRVPLDVQKPSQAFLFNCPPLVRYPQPVATPKPKDNDR